MWANWRLLDGIARALFAAALALGAYFAAVAVVNSERFPLRIVRVVGEVDHVRADAILAHVSARLSGNFFAADLDSVRGAIEQVPWVRRAAVRRQWPDRLLVRIEEHVPVARWPDRRLVNTHGELFEAELERVLPRFAGPPGAELEVSARYAAFTALLAPLGTPLAEVTLSPRRAWSLRLADGMTVEVGADRPPDTAETRLARFVSSYPQAAALLHGRVQHADLRYPNGFALRVSAPAEAAGGGARATSAVRRDGKE
ncbi:MAG: cell division protein FtsQ/DivIB [Burkholderiales bacterium]|nr:cell division protein FtsQ/DivIB [Burkholderiales bacterium]